MALAAYTPTVYVNDSAPAQNATNLNKTETAIKDVTDEVILQEAKIADLEAPASTPYAPQAVAPTYSEGQMYYDSVKNTPVVESPFSNSPIRPGFNQPIYVINLTGAGIEKGMAVRHDGVDGSGRVKIVKAIATSFVNARILGVTDHAIADTAEGVINRGGIIYSVDTSAVAVGVPLYLSDTVAGTWTATPPAIWSQVGGALTSSATGDLFVSIINNTNLPTIYGTLKSLTTPAVAVTTTAQDIANYVTSTSEIITNNATTGVITLPNAGRYRNTFTSSISFTSTTSTRSVTFEIYDITGATIAYSFVKNIPRDATSDSISFSFPFISTAGGTIKVRVKSSVAITVTFNSIVFDVESVSIK